MLQKGRKTSFRSGFTLIELLVVVGVVSLLISLLVPALAAARGQAKRAVCASNLRQLTMATVMYAGDARGLLPPCGWWNEESSGYWWGCVLADRVDHTVSPLYKYIRSRLDQESVFECPEQPWGTYTPQPSHMDNQATSTYGYNGYYLTPPATPGWVSQISKRPWQRMETIPSPAQVFLFADALIAYASDGMPSNDALLDPPFLYQGKSRGGLSTGMNSWRANDYPTTAFRHRGLTVAACCDGHVDSFSPDGGRITSPRYSIGSVGPTNGPHYVPDWRSW
jgi:prepilin-type N-terminal cleavage/methylation domain-containing protein